MKKVTKIFSLVLPICEFKPKLFLAPKHSHLLPKGSTCWSTMWYMSLQICVHSCDEFVSLFSCYTYRWGTLQQWLLKWEFWRFTMRERQFHLIITVREGTVIWNFILNPCSIILIRSIPLPPSQANYLFLKFYFVYQGLLLSFCDQCRMLSVCIQFIGQEPKTCLLSIVSL